MKKLFTIVVTTLLLLVISYCKEKEAAQKPSAEQVKTCMNDCRTTHASAPKEMGKCMAECYKAK